MYSKKLKNRRITMTTINERDKQWLIDNDYLKGDKNGQDEN